jgi:putative transposase
MQIGNRFHCSPTSLQQQVLLQWIGAQRFIYNAKVQEDRYFRAFRRKFSAENSPIDQQYAQFRADAPWMESIPGVVLRNGAVRWKTAYARYFKKLAKRPSIHKKAGEQSVWLTSELFQFTPKVDADGVITGYRLLIGTKKHPVGEVAYTAHREFRLPASIHIGVHNGRWHLSFNYDDGVPEPSDKDTAAWLMQFGEAELLSKTFGGDRGVSIPLAGNLEERFDLRSAERKRIAKKQAAAKRWQRKLAKRAKGGANRRKAIGRVGRLRAYEARVRTDFAHQTSHALAEDQNKILYVFEALSIARMTKKPKAKPDPKRPGHWLKNQARAKAGLSAAILSSCWGRTRTFLAYKARRKGKLLIEVSPHYTSQECAECGHIHPDNRPDQERFVCQACGHLDNADHNAARVIARRGVRLILSGGWSPKDKKRCAIRKQKDPEIGADCAESPALPATPVETLVSRSRRKTVAPMSEKQEWEAPASCQQ